MTIKLGVSGAFGRMGQAITELALKDPDFNVCALLEHARHPRAGESVSGVKVVTDNAAFAGCDAVIEFTLPEGTLKNLEACAKHKVKMVIGTTGFTPEQAARIKEAAQNIPVVFSTNMSIGVNILFKLIELTAKKIGQSAISIEETHHVHKKDAPSGTAKTMAEVAEKSSGRPVEKITPYREGEVIGDHTITFETAEDILTIRHQAKARAMFAKGALAAAKFLQDKKSGLYHMQDVLGLSAITVN